MNNNTSSNNQDNSSKTVDAFLKSNLFLQMHPQKKAIITKLISQTKGKAPKEALPYLIRANTELKRMNMTFSREESAQIFLLLTADMPEEKKEQLKHFFK